MKITAAIIYVVRIDGRHPIIVELETDAGITGFGEAATAVNNAFAYLNPGKSAFPGHLSDYAPAPGETPTASPTA